MAKLAFRIYRIDTENQDLNSIGLDDIPQKIINGYNQSKGKVIYTSLSASDNQGTLDENKKIIFFKKETGTTLPHSWKTFFEDIGVSFGRIRTEVHHIVGFIVVQDKEQIFAVSTGQAYVTFEKFIDYNFPLDLARKIVHPEIKSGEIKELTGYLQASSLQFRRPRRVSVAEAVSSIWTQLSGYLRSEVLQIQDFKEIFGEKKKAGVEIKASFGIKLKVEHPSQLAKYVDWLLDVYQNYNKPSDSGDDFGFLDAVRKLSRRRNISLINKLEEQLLEQFKNRNFENFDLCHKDHTSYLNADHYERTFGDTEVKTFDIPPTIEEILNEIVEDSSDIKSILENCNIEAQYDAESYRDTGATVRELLCGEIVDADKTYFLLNNEWYELRNNFIDIIKDSFDSIVSDTDFNSNLQLPVWTQSKEHEYNHSFNDTDNFIVGDIIFSENTELFDLLYWDSDRLYIIHAKSGFNVKVRDIASQIFNAAQIIESDILTGKTILNGHYDKICQKYNAKISKEKFLQLFDRQRYYVLAYGLSHNISQDPSKVRSNIAKLEIVQLKNDMKRFEDKAHLKLQWINKE